jgi:hypothetical protein
MTHPVRPVTVRAVIPAPPGEVLAFVADTRNDPEWCPNVESAELVEGDGVSAGSVFRFRQHLDTPGSKRVEFDGEVTIADRTDRSIRWRVSDRFQERDITLTVEPYFDGTRITQVTHATFLRPPGLGRWLYPLLARRTFRDQFAQLAARLS